MIPGLGQRNYKMSLEHLMVPKVTNVLKKQWKHDERAEKSVSDGQTWSNLSNKVNRIIVSNNLQIPTKGKE